MLQVAIAYIDRPVASLHASGAEGWLQPITKLWLCPTFRPLDWPPYSMHLPERMSILWSIC